MTITSSRSSGSFDSDQNFYIPMPSIDETPRISAHELQPWGADEDVAVKPSWRSLFVFTARSHAPSIAIALIATLASSMFRPAAAIFFGRVFGSLTAFGAGNATAQDTLHSVATSCIVLVGLGGGAWIIEGAFLASWVHFGELQAKCVRDKMFEGMLSKEMEWYDSQQNGIGSLLVRIETQIRELQLAVSQPLGFLTFEVFGSLASLGLAFYYSWSLTLVIIAVFPIAAICLFLVSIPLSPAVEAQKQELSQASKFANAAITAIDTVKAYNGQEQEVWQYHSTIKRVAAKYMIQARCNALQFGITKFLMIGIFVQGFWFGLYLVDKGMDPGHVLTTFWACLAAMQSIEVVLPQWLVLVKGMSAGETLNSIMVQVERGRKVKSMIGTTKLKACPGDIEINGVSFAYPSNLQRSVLNNVTFFFPAGETTYIVGKSGSGKSTLGNLLMKYYDPLRGEILIDGHSIHTLDAEWLRQNVMLVQQQAILFNETVYQNIAFGGKGDVTKADVLNASQTGDLRQTILDLPEGIDTLVGSNGKSLSGGQQQRIAIARARLRDAPIVILDEATAALDHTSRQKVLEEIRKWRKKKTTIVITHDISQILDDEYVYVLDHGIVVQEGYCKKLADKGRGMFASFLSVKTPTEQSTSPEQRRQAEPVSPTTPDSDDESGNARWKAIAKVFGVRQATISSEMTAVEYGLDSNDAATSPAQGLFQEPVWSAPSPPKPISTPLLGSPRPVSMIFHSPRPQSIADFQGPRRPSHGETLKIRVTSYATAAKGAQPRPMPPSINTTNMPASSPLPSRQNSILPSGQRSSSKTPGKVKHASYKKILGTIWPTLSWVERVYFVMGLVFALIVGGSTPVFAYIFARLLNIYNLPGNRVAQGELWAFALLGIAVVDAISTFCMHYALEHSGQAWVNALRVEALKRILAQPRSWFDKEKNSAARLNECLDRNAEEMRNLVGRFAGPIFTIFWMLGISIIWAFVVSWKLTLVAIGCTPAVYLTSRLFSHIASKWEEKCSALAAQASSTFNETFSNIRVVRALTLESHFKRKYTLSTTKTYQTGVSRAIYSGLALGLNDGIGFFVTATIMYYGAVIVTNGSINVGSNLQVVNLILFGIGNSVSTLSLIPQLSQSQTTATHMIKLSRLPLKSHENRGTRRLATPFPIIFSNLNFTYPSRQKYQTISSISLTLRPGSCTALVGPSGSGKSTLSSLILALYPPDAVQPHQTPPLTFSGIPVEQCNISSLRSHIAIVPQTPVLFPTTIFQNIIYGLPEGSPFASLCAAILAAKDAGIHDFVQSLPNGYNTFVGEGGQGLSGGQAQRIAIARALVRRPKVLILDEATSALDAVSAEMVRETVARLIERGKESGEGGTAVLVVSHGVEMMRVCETVVVLENGLVVEKGGFDELRRRGGALARLLGEKGVVSGNWNGD